jgi:hypothetical protein
MRGDRDRATSQRGCTPLACYVGWSAWRSLPIPYAATTNFLGVGSFQKVVDDSKMVPDGLGRWQNERTRQNVIKYLLPTDCLIKCLKENGFREQFVSKLMRSCKSCFFFLCWWEDGRSVSNVSGLGYVINSRIKMKDFYIYKKSV